MPAHSRLPTFQALPNPPTLTAASATARPGATRAHFACEASTACCLPCCALRTLYTATHGVHECAVSQYRHHHTSPRHASRAAASIRNNVTLAPWHTLISSKCRTGARDKSQTTAHTTLRAELYTPAVQGTQTPITHTHSYPIVGVPIERLRSGEKPVREALSWVHSTAVSAQHVLREAHAALANGLSQDFDRSSFGLRLPQSPSGCPKQNAPKTARQAARVHTRTRQGYNLLAKAIRYRAIRQIQCLWVV